MVDINNLPHCLAGLFLSWTLTISPAASLSVSLFPLLFRVTVFNGWPVVNPVTSGANTRTHLQNNENTQKSTETNQLHLAQHCILKSTPQNKFQGLTNPVYVCIYIYTLNIITIRIRNSFIFWEMSEITCFLAKIR